MPRPLFPTDATLGITEEGINAAGTMQDAHDLDAAGDDAVKDDESGKAIDMPAANIGMGRLLKAEADTDFGHCDKLVECPLSTIDKAKCHIRSGFGEEVVGEGFDIESGKRGFVYSIRHGLA